MTAHGSYQQIDGRPALYFERRLAHPVDAVWRAITEPDELVHWFPNAVEIDLRVGGKMTFEFLEAEMPPMDGEVVELDPPRRFWFRWGEDELRFELEPLDGGKGCLLRFTDLLATSDKAARDGAGWHVCLDGLERLLSGTPAERPYPKDEWRPHYDHYVAAGVPSGAPVPG